MSDNNPIVDFTNADALVKYLGDAMRRAAQGASGNSCNLMCFYRDDDKEVVLVSFTAYRVSPEFVALLIAMQQRKEFADLKAPSGTKPS